MRAAERSNDPNTKVGAALIDLKGTLITSSWNKFPSGIAATSERMNNRETKLKLIVHAEMGAIFAACRKGLVTKNAMLYLAATDPVTGEWWGGPPCTRCTVEAIAAGITEIVSLPQKVGPSKWREDLNFARTLLAEAGVRFREIAVP